jgi:hypothetical protein
MRNRLLRLLFIGLVFTLPAGLRAADPGPPYVILQYENGKPAGVFMGHADREGVRVEYSFLGPVDGWPKAVPFPTPERPSRGRVFVAVSPEEYKAVRALAVAEAAADRGGADRLVSGIVVYLDLRVPPPSDLKDSSKFLRGNSSARPGAADGPGPLVFVAPVTPRESSLAGEEAPAPTPLLGGEVAQQQWLARIRALQAQARQERKENELQDRLAWLARQAAQAATEQEAAARLRQHDEANARFGQRFDEQLARGTDRMDQRSAEFAQGERDRQKEFRVRMDQMKVEARENLEKLVRLIAGDPSAVAAGAPAVAKPPAPAGSAVPASPGGNAPLASLPNFVAPNLGNAQLKPPSLPPGLSSAVAGGFQPVEPQRGPFRLLDDISLRPPSVSPPHAGQATHGTTPRQLPLDPKHSVIDRLKSWNLPSDRKSRSQLYGQLFGKPFDGSGEQNGEFLRTLGRLGKDEVARRMTGANGSRSIVPPFSPGELGIQTTEPEFCPYALGPRGERLRVPSCWGPVRPVEEYQRPRARDYAKLGFYDVAEREEFYMCPSCHIGTKIDPRDYNHRNYVESYQRNYAIGRTLLVGAAVPLAAPRLALALAGYEGTLAAKEAITGRSAGYRTYDLMRGRFEPGRPLSTEERLLSAAEVPLTLLGARLGSGQGGTSGSVSRTPRPPILPESGPTVPLGKAGSARPGIGEAGPNSVVELQVGRYGDLASRSVRDGLSPDHIPSFAAIRTDLEGRIGRQLTSSEASALYKDTHAIIVKTRSHQLYSRTYGGRNTTGQIQGDAANLQGAFILDRQAWRQQLIKEGHSPAAVDATFRVLDALNRRAGRY